MQLTGGALARLEQLTPEGCEARIDLSITDDWPLAQAFVIISAVVRRQGLDPGGVCAGEGGQNQIGCIFNGLMSFHARASLRPDATV